jgi:hypothetical protein
METGPEAEIVLVAVPARFTTVTFPAKSPSVWSCCPTTYIVDVFTRALLEPPGIGSVQVLTFGVDEQSACKVVFVGNAPDCCPARKIIDATGTIDTDATEPPHSGPQLSTYAVLPSDEKTDFTGRSKTRGVP